MGGLSIASTEVQRDEVPRRGELREEGQRVLQVCREGESLERGKCAAGQRGRKGRDVRAVAGAALNRRCKVNSFEVREGGQFGGDGAREEVHRHDDVAELLQPVDQLKDLGLDVPRRRMRPHFERFQPGNQLRDLSGVRQVMVAVYMEGKVLHAGVCEKERALLACSVDAEP
jgi:hypothetical protein